jgi:hypothetical protein
MTSSSEEKQTQKQYMKGMSPMGEQNKIESLV